MAKIKILKPVVNRGKLHHKIGSVVEVDDKDSALLRSKGYAESAPASAEVTKGATIDSSGPKPTEAAKEKE